jgi:rod shape-determining protein MreB
LKIDRKLKIIFMFSKKIGIDLGTSTSIVFVHKKGIVLNEPSVVAVSMPENKVLAVGNEAKEMIGRTPENIVVYRPMREGVIADYQVTQAMLKYFIQKAIGKWSFLKPEVVVAVPDGATSTEKRAVVEAGLVAGAKAVYPVKSSILAAIGADLPIYSCSGHMVVDIGGGTTEIAIISLGGIVYSRSVRIGGDKLDSVIMNYVKERHNLAIGEQTAEMIKIKIGTAFPKRRKDEILEIKGRDLVSGLPRQIKISANEVCEAIQEPLTEIIQQIKQVLKKIPPELSADIIDKGMILCGGGANLRNIEKLVTKMTGVPSVRVEEPNLCVIRGTGAILPNIDLYKKSLLIKV